jgi:hypothetical protein
LQSFLPDDNRFLSAVNKYQGQRGMQNSKEESRKVHVLRWKAPFRSLHLHKVFEDENVCCRNNVGAKFKI